MYEFHYDYTKNKYSDRAKLLFTDTDSLAYEIKTEDFYADIANDVESKFDTSEFDKNYPAINKVGFKVGVNNKVLGMFKDEAKGAQIEEFVGLRSKLYSYKVHGKEKKKCKGVKKNVVAKSITQKDYKDCLFNDNDHLRTMNVIRSHGHEIYTDEVNKVALSAADDKRVVLENDIDTLAYEHYKLKDGKIKVKVFNNNKQKDAQINKCGRNNSCECTTQKLSVNQSSKKLKPKHFRGVFVRDQLPKKTQKEEFGIVNTGDSSTQGFHWVCWHKEGDKKIYFDSYGLPPLVEVVDYSLSGDRGSLAKRGNQVSFRNPVQAQRLLLSGDRGSLAKPGNQGLLSFGKKPSASVAIGDRQDTAPVYSNSERVQFGDTSFCGHLCPSGLSVASTIFSYSEGPRILRRLWIAVNGTYANGKSVPGNVFLRIYVDGVIYVGNYAIDTEGIGYDHVSLALDLLFSPLGGSYYANALQVCNLSNFTSLGGYFTFHGLLITETFTHTFSGMTELVNVFYSSSGLEDFYLSSWNGANLTSFNIESSGLLYQSTSSIVPISIISFYRNFGDADSGTMPSVSTGRRMLVTLNSGDAQVGQSGSYYLLLGQAYF